MITEGMINIIFPIITGLLTLLPDLSWEIDGTVFETFFNVLESVCYFFPVETVTIILGLNIALTCFKSIISLIKTIWGLLPLV